MANVVWTLGNATYKQYPIRPFEEFISRDRQPEDNRSGQEILEDLKRKFMGRVNNGSDAHGACHKANA